MDKAINWCSYPNYMAELALRRKQEIGIFSFVLFSFAQNRHFVLTLRCKIPEYVYMISLATLFLKTLHTIELEQIGNFSYQKITSINIWWQQPSINNVGKIFWFFDPPIPLSVLFSVPNTLTYNLHGIFLKKETRFNVLTSYLVKM